MLLEDEGVGPWAQPPTFDINLVKSIVTYEVSTVAGVVHAAPERHTLDPLLVALAAVFVNIQSLHSSIKGIDCWLTVSLEPVTLKPLGIYIFSLSYFFKEPHRHAWQ